MRRLRNSVYRHSAIPFLFLSFVARIERSEIRGNREAAAGIFPSAKRIRGKTKNHNTKRLGIPYESKIEAAGISSRKARQAVGDRYSFGPGLLQAQ